MKEIEGFDQQSDGLSLNFGINDALVKAVVEQTHSDEGIQKYTHDTDRFGNYEVARAWFNEHEVYTLTDVNNELAGIVFFDSKEWPLDGESPEYTFAIRTYHPFRGRGFAFSFAQFAIDDFMMRNDLESVWLVTDEDNPPAYDLYKRLGWIDRGKVFDEDRNKHRIVMSFTLEK